MKISAFKSLRAQRQFSGTDFRGHLRKDFLQIAETASYPNAVKVAEGNNFHNTPSRDLKAGGNVGNALKTSISCTSPYICQNKRNRLQQDAPTDISAKQSPPKLFQILQYECYKHCKVLYTSLQQEIHPIQSNRGKSESQWKVVFFVCVAGK